MSAYRKEKELDEGVKATHKNIYTRLSRFKKDLHNQPEPILWFTEGVGFKGKKELRVHYGTLEEYRQLGYGHHNPHGLIFSLGTGAYVTLTEQLNSAAVDKLGRAVYSHVHGLAGL